MTQPPKVWLPPFIASLAVTPLALLIGIGSGGAGHGDYFWAVVLFPFTMISTVIWGSIVPFFVLVAFVQFPAYGLIVAVTRQGYRFISAALIIVVHVVAVVFCVATISENFRN